jgi:hypothetical protein
LYTIAIRIGFELPGYTYSEPPYYSIEVIDQFFVSATGRPKNGPIYLIKEDNVTSEQTFLVSINVTDEAPSGIQSATFGQDYRLSVPTRIHSIFFNASQQRVPFAFTLLADYYAFADGTEAFQARVSSEDTRDIGGGIVEQFPTFQNPISLASDVFITIEAGAPERKLQISLHYQVLKNMSFLFSLVCSNWLCSYKLQCH